MLFRSNEKPGPGRYREFFQFDADVVGVDSTLIDAELCVMVCDILIDLGLNTSQFEINFQIGKFGQNFFRT